ncbi:WhiB family transcriptional regulator [Streptomyces sp. NBC_00825]|uniref:WhiB family transcriptional regulator n=1 Tax=unclassified Streptomyces TaxID=2593676 RepID=UPI002ED293F2|nr:WhiB family transcriptional regulator [Streptomyces sp. NBC_00826]WTH94213.1 WhiB family transcriptional regulator [Streptomyces sp. NBC_00825]WTI02948.1 WhiB family transcriptional regulator [Streptomyces sp. NBC_00822]
MSRPSRYSPDTRPRRAHWSDEAVCRDEDASIFFPEEFPGAEVPLITLQAKAVCDRCPVIGPCLESALALPERHGVFGGLDKNERQALRRREQRRARKRAALLQKETTDAFAAAEAGSR